ncbi:MAG: enoyl-CoA hydratase/isomerase family protein [Acidimicrobiia bacterium]
MSVHVEDRDGVRVVLLDRPSKRNALDIYMVEGIREAIGSAPGIAVVVGSTDPRSFSAGADLDLADTDRAAMSDSLYDLYLFMRATPKVLIAAASGHAVGGGAQLLIACDLRLAGPDTAIRFVGPGHGLAVGAWGLPSLIGRGRAMDLCLSMRTVGADEALAMGLVDRVVDEPLDRAIEYGAQVSDLDPGAVAMVKRIIAVSDIGEALRLERAENSAWDGAIPRSPTSEQ